MLSLHPVCNFIRRLWSNCLWTQPSRWSNPSRLRRPAQKFRDWKNRYKTIQTLVECQFSNKLVKQPTRKIMWTDRSTRWLSLEKWVSFLLMLQELSMLFSACDQLCNHAVTIITEEAVQYEFICNWNFARSCSSYFFSSLLRCFAHSSFSVVSITYFILWFCSGGPVGESSWLSADQHSWQASAVATGS